jgi:hypothetical protein
MTTLNPATLLRVSVQRTLVGEVTPNLIAVTCGISEQRILIRAFFDGPVSESDRARFQAIGTEVTADFTDDYIAEEECLSTNDKSEEMLDFWAFRRATRV